MDQDAGPSQSAVMTAVARALHREEPPPWVLDDEIASALAGEPGEGIRRRLGTELSAESLLAFSRWCCVRSRFPEDIVEHELTANGVRQYVVLGAGLDTFAVRRNDLLEDLRVFEVDHPSSQQWKRQRLADLDVSTHPNVAFVPVDFERQRLDEELQRAGYDPAEPAVFAWIGVIMYLSRQAIDSTLAIVASGAPGTQVVLTYDLPMSTLGDMGAATQSALGRMVADMGEPMVSHFTPAEIEDVLRGHGFGDLVHIGPDEARSRYFADRADVTFGGAQRLLAGTM